MNFQYHGTLGGVSPAAETFKVDSGTTSSIKLGDLFVVTAGYAVALADGGMASAGKYALATSDSTETSSAAGVVDGQYCPSGLQVIGKATTPGNLTQALMFTDVSVDVSAGVITIDENSGSGVLTMHSFDNTTDGHVVADVPWTV